jgi:hypothetical protein
MIVTEGTSYHERVMGKPIPCRRYGQEPITAAAIADPRRFADHQGLDARTLFRRPTRAARGGNRPVATATAPMRCGRS